MGVELPSLAALAVLAVFAQTGIWADGDELGWAFGVWLVAGAVPWLVAGFPWLAASAGAALVVAAVRIVLGGRGKCRSSSTATAVDG